jgi:hypothetical protein
VLTAELSRVNCVTAYSSDAEMRSAPPELPENAKHDATESSSRRAPGPRYITSCAGEDGVAGGGKCGKSNMVRGNWAAIDRSPT